MKKFLKNLWSNRGSGWRLARISLLLCAGLVITLMILEERLIFFPTKYPDGLWDTSKMPVRDGDLVPKIEDCHFKASDLVPLHGWYCTPHRMEGSSLQRVPSKMVLLWFHGNAGNLTYRYDMIRMLMALPVEILIIDYRGYGKSEGSPSEKGLYLDARGAWDYLVNQRGIAPDRIIILGKSLGGVPAIELAGRVSPAGLIVQSSFTSAADMAHTILPFYPGLLLRSKMDSINKIASVRCPKLFIHSPSDEVVPYALGRRLFEAAPEPKRFYEVKNAPHNSTYLMGGKPYLEALRAFIESCSSTEGSRQ